MTYTLFVEITRRCQLRCAHCMRGDAQAVDLSQDGIARAKSLVRIRKPSIMILTGGEPFLNLKGLADMLMIAKQEKIPVTVVTNGPHLRGGERLMGEMLADTIATYGQLLISRTPYHEELHTPERWWWEYGKETCPEVRKGGRATWGLPHKPDPECKDRFVVLWNGELTDDCDYPYDNPPLLTEAQVERRIRG